jgi:hypothetical protein
MFRFGRETNFFRFVLAGRSSRGDGRTVQERRAWPTLALRALVGTNARDLRWRSPHLFTPVVARVSRASASVNPRAAARAVTGVVPNAIAFAEAVEP